MMQVGTPRTARTVGAIGTERQREMALRIARGIWKSVPPHVPLADLEQVALTELWEALQRKGSQASIPYLLICIRGRVKDELRKHDWLPRRARHDGRNLHVIHAADVGEHFEERLSSPAPSPEETTNAKRLAAEIWQAPLPPRERQILLAHYERGLRFADIAAGLGISEPRVSQIHHRAIAIVKAWLTGELDRDARSGNRTYVPLRLRKAIMEKHAAHPNDRRSDRAPGGAESEPPSPDTFLDRVRAGRLGVAPDREPDRPRPGGSGAPERPAAEPADLRDAAPAAPQAPAEAVAEPSPEERELAAVPSVLPEGGLDLRAELARYRDWIIEQALIRTGGHQAKAARLLGFQQSSFSRALRLGGGAFTGLRKARKKRGSVPATSPAMKPPHRRAEHGDSLSDVISRLPRDEVAEWHGQGKTTGWIARQLTNRVGAGHALTEMAVRRTLASMAANGGV
ncbi:MAG TPA: sigma-70 family RNA polymerase sigma factor [Gaiellaceae bacterium]